MLTTNLVFGETWTLDAASFEVMRSRRLREALAFDQDFGAAGFVELRN